MEISDREVGRRVSEAMIGLEHTYDGQRTIRTPKSPHTLTYLKAALPRVPTVGDVNAVMNGEGTPEQVEMVRDLVDLLGRASDGLYEATGDE